MRVLGWATIAVALGCGTDPAPHAAGGHGGSTNTAAGSAGLSSGGGGATTGGSGGGGGVTDGGAGGSQAGMAGTATAGSSGSPAGPLFPPLIDGCDIPAAHERADRALAALLVDFWNGTEQYLNSASPSTGNSTGYWTYAQAFDALLDGVERTGGERYRGLIRAFYDGRDQRGWLVDYYDDESWMTMTLLRAYDLTGDELYLEQAKTIYTDIMAGWDTTCCGEHLGGIWWNKQHAQKATASNAGPVIGGVRLAARSGDDQYLTFARQVYDFWMEHMVDQASFAIFDHFSPPDGARAPGSLTYNHGIMIGAALELHAATGEQHFLDEAHGFGHYLATVPMEDSEVGPVFNDFGTNCDGDCPAWKGIGYRYMALLFQQDPTRTEYRDVLVDGAEAIWTLARNPDTDHFSAYWMGPPPTAGGIEEQGSATMALNLHAMLCGSDLSAAPVIAGRYEAEEARLEHVALEAQYAGYSGFGYVAAFAEDEQGVVFEVDAASSGMHQISWTYAAAAGAATRSVLVNGALVSAAQSFAATGAWDTWASVDTTLELAQGPNLVELRFDEAAGSVAPLNVDRIDVTN
ncbi:MAG TPA: glycoside hydrolase family 76 protein [Polyangiaceae bacterium]|nr:glycoside hydrolase family 76 protein [Polyangiaceae bacterium]